MPTVRTVFNPDTPREVDEHEATQLAREGLLLPLEGDEPPAPAEAPAASVETSAPAAPKATTVPTPTPPKAPSDGKQEQ